MRPDSRRPRYDEQRKRARVDVISTAPWGVCGRAGSPRPADRALPPTRYLAPPRGRAQRPAARVAVVSNTGAWENSMHEKASRPSRRTRDGRRAASPLAKTPRRPEQSGGRTSQGAPRSGGAVHGVRERTGEYGAAQGPPEGPEADGEPLGSTRDFETAQGTLSYTQVSELYKLALPHAETAPLAPEARRHYVRALSAGDAGDLGPLRDLWTRRISEAL